MNALSMLLFATTAFTAPTTPPPSESSNTPAQAAYFLLNRPQGNGNQIVSYKINAHGLLIGSPSLSATGGLGSIGLSGNQPVSADALFSEGSVQVVGNFLFAVNAGSNSLTMFTIDSSNATALSQLGNPVSTKGSFPNSVAYSAALNLACVTNTGTTNGISCFTVNSSTGLSANSPLMNANAFTQSTPPNGPQLTYSSISWSPQSDYLLATIKGNSSAGIPSQLVQIRYNANTGTFGSASTRNLTSLSLAFGFTFINETSIWVVNPGFGGAIISGLPFTAQSTLQQDLITLLGDKVTCWAAIRPDLSELYAIDAAQNIIYSVATSDQVVSSFNNGNPAGVSGTFDPVIQNGILYALSGGTGINVINVLNNANQQLQWFNTSSASTNRTLYEGLAIYPAVS